MPSVAKPHRSARRRPLAVLLLGLAPLLTGPAAAEPALQTVAGTHVALVPPPGFAPSPRFSGFEHPDTHASILVVEMPPNAYAGVAAAFTPEVLATRGMTAAEQSRLTDLAQDNILVQATQTVGSLTVRKLLLLVAGDAVTVLVNGNVPIATEQPGDVDALLAAYRTLEIRAEAAPMALPFRLGYRGGFREHRRLAGQTVLYADTTQEADLTPTTPVFIVAPSLGNPVIADVKTAARRLFDAIDAVRGQVVTEETALMVDGLAGWEMLGAGAEASTGAPALLYQALLLDQGRYFRLVGTAPLADIETYAADFKRITRSFTRAEANAAASGAPAEPGPEPAAP